MYMCMQLAGRRQSVWVRVMYFITYKSFKENQYFHGWGRFVPLLTTHTERDNGNMVEDTTIYTVQCSAATFKKLSLLALPMMACFLIFATRYLHSIRLIDFQLFCLVEERYCENWKLENKSKIGFFFSDEHTGDEQQYCAFRKKVAGDRNGISERESWIFQYFFVVFRGVFFVVIIDQN